jgi:L-amino acid N-acyltransferase YncA
VLTLSNVCSRSGVSDRCAYAGVAEDSIYVAAEAQGRGVGRLLLGALVSGAEQAGIWTVQTGIFPENQASMRLHQGCLRVPGGGGAGAPGPAPWPLAGTSCCWSAAAR